MRFSTTIIIVLGLELAVNAKPVPEGIRIEAGSENAFQPRAPAPPKATPKPASKSNSIKPHPKFLKLHGYHYKTLPYPPAPQSEKKGVQRTNIPEIMDDTRFTGLHGVYIPDPKNPQKLQKVPKAGMYRVETDHVFEAQTLSKFLKRLEKPTITGYFLANHKGDYFLQASTAIRKVSPNFHSNNYIGSLYQHLMRELGSVEHLDRLAVVYGPTNNRKKGIWALHESTAKGIDAFYELGRVNDLLVAERLAWCATATGIKNVLTKFRAGRQPPTPPPSPSGATGTISKRSDKHPINHVARSPTKPPTNPPVTPGPRVGRPSRGGKTPNYIGPDYGFSPIKTPQKSKDDDKDYNEEPSDTSPGDIDGQPLSDKYAGLMDLPYDDDFVTFLKEEIEAANELMITQLNDLANTLSGPEKALVKGYKVTFGEALLRCAPTGGTGTTRPQTPSPEVTPDANPIPGMDNLSLNSPVQPDTPTPADRSGTRKNGGGKGSGKPKRR